MIFIKRSEFVYFLLAASAFTLPAFPQAPEPAPSTAESAPSTDPPGGKRVFGVLPNYRTADSTEVYAPIPASRKLYIASKDSFDYPLVLLAGVFAGLGQITNANPSFGQGMAGYGRRLGTGYADQAIGNMMAEGFFPMMLHEDPRYFRLGSGSVRKRTVYALTRVLITHPDSSRWRFNYSEWLGNATGVAISNSYYPDNRDVGDNVEKLLTQVGTDAISQVLKEFWPDIKRKLHHNQDTASNH
jgi:hypothetical protein